jgi:hypothetical protein
MTGISERVLKRLTAAPGFNTSITSSFFLAFFGSFNPLFSIGLGAVAFI